MKSAQHDKESRVNVGHCYDWSDLNCYPYFDWQLKTQGFLGGLPGARGGEAVYGNLHFVGTFWSSEAVSLNWRALVALMSSFESPPVTPSSKRRQAAAQATKRTCFYSSGSGIFLSESGGQHTDNRPVLFWVTAPRNGG